MGKELGIFRGGGWWAVVKDKRVGSFRGGGREKRWRGGGGYGESLLCSKAMYLSYIGGPINEVMDLWPP